MMNSKQAIELGIIDKLLSTFDDKQIRKSLAELKTQLFAKSDWSKIIIMLKKRSTSIFEITFTSNESNPIKTTVAKGTSSSRTFHCEVRTY